MLDNKSGSVLQRSMRRCPKLRNKVLKSLIEPYKPATGKSDHVYSSPARKATVEHLKRDEIVAYADGVEGEKVVMASNSNLEKSASSKVVIMTSWIPACNSALQPLGSFSENDNDIQGVECKELPFWHNYERVTKTGKTVIAPTLFVSEFFAKVLTCGNLSPHTTPPDSALEPVAIFIDAATVQCIQRLVSSQPPPPPPPSSSCLY
jgi:hypothetical protein